MSPRGIAGSGSATMTRPRSGTTNTNKSMQPWSTVLFQFGNLVGLPASNQYGFDILAYQDGGYVSVLNDPKFCAQVIGWLLNQQGKLKGNIAGVTAGTTGAVGGSATHAAPVRRGGRSSTSISRTRTPALATSVNSSSSGA